MFFVQAPEFPEFTAKVQEAISSLGGSVFPKLNWSAPRVRMLTPKTCNRCYICGFWCVFVLFCIILMHWKVEETSAPDEGTSDRQDVSEI